MKVLFCGGPVHGQWRDVEDVPAWVNATPTYVEVVAPPTPLEAFTGTGTLTKKKYRVWWINLLGRRLYVAAPEADHNESDSVLYAVLQRDVADHLTGKS